MDFGDVSGKAYFVIQISIWGQYNEEPAQNSEIRLRFDDGDDCLGHIHRSTNVFLFP